MYFQREEIFSLKSSNSVRTDKNSYLAVLYYVDVYWTQNTDWNLEDDNITYETEDVQR